MTKTTAAKTAKKTAADAPTQDQQRPLIIPNTVITLTLPKEQVMSAYNKTLSKLAKQVKIAGFRKGKVPARVAEEHLSPQTTIEETLQVIVPEAYTEAVKKLDKQPLTYPEFNPTSLDRDADWIVEAHFAQAPEIDLKDYKASVVAAQKEARAELKKKAAETKESEKAAEKASAQPETTETDVKDAPKTPAKLTPEQENNVILQHIYQKLVQDLKPQIQELLVKEEVRYDLDELKHQLSHMNITLEKLLEHRNITAEDLSNEMAAQALARLQISFIIDEIALKEKLVATEKDMEEHFATVTDPELQKQKNNPRYQQMVRQTIVRKKVADHLLAIA